MLGRLKAQLSTTRVSKDYKKEDDLSKDRKDTAESIASTEQRARDFRPCVKVSIDAGVQTDSFCADYNCKTRPLLVIGRSLVIAAILYFVACILATFSASIQSRLLYANDINWPLGDLTDMARFDLYNGRNIVANTSDGIILHGWLLMAPQPLALEKPIYQNDVFESNITNGKAIILYLHGNAGNRACSHRIGVIKKLSALLDANVVAFDYRGFGDNEGWPSEEGTRIDSHAMYKWIDEHFSYKQSTKVFIYGHSLGSAVAARLAHDITSNYFKRNSELAGVILDSGFTSIANVIIDHPAGIFFRAFETMLRRNLQFHYSTIGIISEIRGNLFLIHGTADSVIPVSHLGDLRGSIDQSCSTSLSTTCGASNSDKSFIIREFVVDGGTHDEMYMSIEWTRELPKFVADVNLNVA